jgi:Rieske 2Fe-2S family protein
MARKPATRKGAPLERTLPSRYYLSDEIFRQEQERIFFREWFCAGREEQIPAPGDLLVLEVAGESVLVVRTKEGDLAAHYNVCRHRGARLCAAGAAPAADDHRPAGPVARLTGAIRCPYHSWTYGLDGRLLGAPHLKEAGLSADEFSLHPVGVDTWGGFFFLNLTPAGAGRRDRGLPRDRALPHGRTLAAQLGRAPRRLGRYPLADLRTVRRIVYEVRANWKVILENYNECYHCGPVHPELCEVVPAFRRAGGANIDWEAGVPHREGATTFTRSGTSNRPPFPGLNENEKTHHHGELIYPNFMLSLSAEHVAAFMLWPTAPDRTTISCDFLFHPEAMARGEFDPADAVEFWDLINRQDWAICERVQGGTRSRMHRFGYYAPMEDLSLDIRRYITARLGRPARA